MGIEEFQIMKNISVFEGNELQEDPPEFQGSVPRCSLSGGTTNRRNVQVPLSDDLLSRHLLFLGGIGTGKTNGIFQVVRQLIDNMTANDVMVIFDTKGDYYSEFHRSGDIVISNDEKASGSLGVDYWNIFNEIPNDELQEETVYEIARTLFSEKAEKSNQPFFPNAARDIFSACLIHFLREGDPEKLSNQFLREFLDQSTAQEIRNALRNDPNLMANISYISDDRSPQTQGVLSELHQTIQETFIGNFRKKGSISIRDIIRKKGKKIIFIEYDLGIGKVLLPIYRLMIDLAIKEALCRKKSEGNVWFIIDEFRLLPNLSHVDDGINFGRSLGAKFIIGVQNVQQVFHAYGEELARSILSGFSTTISFRVHDHTTRTYIQQLLGKNRKREVYMASVQARGMIENVRDANVVEDWDIDNLHLGEAIISFPELEPFKFQFARYK